MTGFKAHFKSEQPALSGSLPGHLIFGIPGKDGGYYLVSAEQTDANTIRFTFTPSRKEMPAVDPVDITLPNATGAGLTTAQINALDGMFKVCSFTKPDVSAEYNAFKNAFGIGGGEEPDVPDVPDVPDEPDVPEKTLTSISVVYSGGSVAAGTAVNDLTGIVVTAHYSDGTSEAVTGYTLSGTIAEGSNIVTVTYEGKTATFAVAGVAESGGEETGVSNETTWTDGVAYTYTPVVNVYVETNGSFKDYNGWSRTPYLYCKGATKLRSECVYSSGSITGGNGNYSAFYDADKNYISSFHVSAGGSEVGNFVDIEIPTNAVYFVVSHKNNVMGVGHEDGPYLKLTPYA